jgi:1-aminocyclopropane-1-carboxylate deaminase/D-cysteine desulfhydrase-like pyridoxal-dependent ACC family enzyme
MESENRPMIVCDPSKLTPVQEVVLPGVGLIYVKRDDLFEIAGVPGGKVRTCYALALRGRAAGATCLVTAGSRASPQVNIVAHVARHLGMGARCHTPTGALSPEVEAAKATGAEIIQHKAGYNSVITARAREDARRPECCEIPFGMECQEAITQTRHQVANIPIGVNRVVVPVGSGMSLAGILHGLIDIGAAGVVPVLGVYVGASPVKRLGAYGPCALLDGYSWRNMVSLTPSGSDYHKPAAAVMLGCIKLDPIYEAKCLRFLCAGDLLWVVGVRATSR